MPFGYVTLSWYGYELGPAGAHEYFEIHLIHLGAVVSEGLID
jgi:hypothetical protein